MHLSAKQAWILARIYQYHDTPRGVSATEFCELNRQHEVSRVPSAMPRIYYDATATTMINLSKPVTRSSQAQNRPPMLTRRPGRPARFILTRAGRTWVEAHRAGIADRKTEVPNA